MTVSEIMEKMIRFSNGNIHDTEHFIKVWSYAKTIGELEGLDAGTQHTLEIAAIVHDIACPLCREKYGSAPGKLQELESPPLVKEFLQDAGPPPEETERIAFLVGHHHTLEGICGLDWQILTEADYLVNAAENAYTGEAIRTYMDRHMKTPSGKIICRALFSACPEITGSEAGRMPDQDGEE